MRQVGQRNYPATYLDKIRSTGYKRKYNLIKLIDKQE